MRYKNKNSFKEKEIKQKLLNHSGINDGWYRRLEKQSMKAGSRLTFYALSGTPPKGYAVYNHQNKELCFYNSHGKRYINAKGIEKVEEAEELKNRQHCPLCQDYVGNTFSQVSHLFFKHGKELGIDWRNSLKTWLKEHDSENLRIGICPLCFKDCNTEQSLFIHSVAAHSSVDLSQIVEKARITAKKGGLNRIIKKTKSPKQKPVNKTGKSSDNDFDSFEFRGGR